MTEETKARAIGLNHVALEVDDIDKALEFYGSIFEFSLRGRSETAAFIEKTQRSPTVDPKDKVKLFKLAWDAVGSEFASRHAQYEMFYSGGEFVTRGRSFNNYDWDNVTDLVDGLLGSYDL